MVLSPSSKYVSLTLVHQHSGQVHISSNVNHHFSASTGRNNLWTRCRRSPVAGHRTQAKVRRHFAHSWLPSLGIDWTGGVGILIAAEVQEEQPRGLLVLIEKVQGCQSVCVLVVTVNPVLPGVDAEGLLRLVERSADRLSGGCPGSGSIMDDFLCVRLGLYQEPLLLPCIFSLRSHPSSADCRWTARSCCTVTGSPRRPSGTPDAPAPALEWADGSRTLLPSVKCVQSVVPISVTYWSLATRRVVGQ